MGQLRFGMLSFPTAPYDALARTWRDAEALGFDSAWLADDLNLPGIADFEAWTILGALAHATTRLRIGTMVSAITHRHPAFLAAQVIAVDHISHGRVELGLGAGESGNNYASLGLDDWSAAERRDRLAEQVFILDRLLGGQPVSYVGQYYRTLTAEMPMPVQQPRPPIIIAAHGTRGLRLTAQYADGWNSMGGQPFPEARYGKSVTLAEAVAATRQRSELLDAYCSEMGRDPAAIRRSIVVYRPRPPDPLSSLDAFDEYVGRYAEIGINEFIFYWPPLLNFLEKRPIEAAQQAFLEQIARERFPRLQGHSKSSG